MKEIEPPISFLYESRIRYLSDIRKPGKYIERIFSRRQCFIECPCEFERRSSSTERGNLHIITVLDEVHARRGLESHGSYAYRSRIFSRLIGQDAEGLNAFPHIKDLSLNLRCRCLGVRGCVLTHRERNKPCADEVFRVAIDMF